MLSKNLLGLQVFEYLHCACGRGMHVRHDIARLVCATTANRLSTYEVDGDKSDPWCAPNGQQRQVKATKAFANFGEGRANGNLFFIFPVVHGMVSGITGENTLSCVSEGHPRPMLPKAHTTDQTSYGPRRVAMVCRTAALLHLQQRRRRVLGEENTQERFVPPIELVDTRLRNAKGLRKAVPIIQGYKNARRG